jgi:hypothetical protein
MKREYDFSKGTRGKFYKTKVRLNLPIYLDSEVWRFVEEIAKNQQSDVSRVVNQLLKTDMKLAQVMQ